MVPPLAPVEPSLEVEPPHEELLQAAVSASRAAAPTPAMIRLFLDTFSLTCFRVWPLIGLTY